MFIVGYQTFASKFAKAFALAPQGLARRLPSSETGVTDRDWDSTGALPSYFRGPVDEAPRLLTGESGPDCGASG